MLSWDFNTATLTAIVVQIIIVVVSVVRTQTKAEGAIQLAQDAKERADDAHEKIALVNASIGMVREQYVHNDDLRNMEARLTATINKVGDRLDQALDRRLPK